MMRWWFSEFRREERIECKMQSAKCKGQKEETAGEMRSEESWPLCLAVVVCGDDGLADDSFQLIRFIDDSR